MVYDLVFFGDVIGSL